MKNGQGPDEPRGGQGPDEPRGGQGPDEPRGGQGPDELRGGLRVLNGRWMCTARPCSGSLCGPLQAHMGVPRA